MWDASSCALEQATAVEAEPATFCCGAFILLYPESRCAVTPVVTGVPHDPGGRQWHVVCLMCERESAPIRVWSVVMSPA